MTTASLHGGNDDSETYVIDLLMAITRYDTSIDEKITTTVMQRTMSFDVPNSPRNGTVAPVLYAIKFHVNVHDTPDSEDKFKLEIAASALHDTPDQCKCACGCRAANKFVLTILPELRKIHVHWQHKVVQTVCGSDEYTIAAVNIYIRMKDGRLVLHGRLPVGAGQKSVTTYM